MPVVTFYLMQIEPIPPSVISFWRINSRVTSYLIEHVNDEILSLKVPGAPVKTVRMIAGHIHNCRCMWIKTLGRKHGFKPPDAVDRYTVSQHDLLKALEVSDAAISDLLAFGYEQGGHLGGFPLDMAHFAAYLTAHEGHHRGQIIMVSRQQGCRLPSSVTAGIWQWSNRAKEID